MKNSTSTGVLEPPKKKILQAYLDGLAFKGVPGIGLDIRTERERLGIYAGTLSIDDDRPITDASYFGFVCLGKPLVAAAILQLSAEALVDLNASVNEYITELQSEKCTSITLKHLLSHTGGYCGPGEKRWKLDRTEAIHHFDASPQLFPPGLVFSEEALDFALLAEIIRRVSGREFHQWIEEEVLAPLALKFTQMHCDASKSFVIGHHFAPNLGEMIKVTGLWASDFWSPAASNLSMPLGSIGELSRYLISGNCNSRPRPLCKSIFSSMHEPAVRLPATIGVGHFPDWRIASFGSGLATFQNGKIGSLATGRGQSLAIVHDEETQTSVALSISNISGQLRSRVLSFVMSCLAEDICYSSIDTRPPPLPEMLYSEFTAGFDWAELAGVYIGTASHLVSVRAGPSGLTVSRPNMEIRVGRLQRGRMMLESNLPVQVGFFADPDGKPALMIGLTAYKKIKPD